MQGFEEGLRSLLVDTGLLSRTQLSTLRQAQGKTLSQSLVETGVLSEDALRRASAHVLGVPFVVLDPHDIEPEVMGLIPEPVARQHEIIAYKQRGNELEVALLSLEALTRIEFLRPRYTILPRLTTRNALTRALHYYQKELRESFGTYIEELKTPEALVRSIVAHALMQRASAVHLTPTHEGLLAYYRIGGFLREAFTLPMRLLQSLLKVLPKEGKVRIELEQGGVAHVRVTLTPTLLGKRLVLHIEPQGTHTLEHLGLHGEGLEALHHTLARRRGLVVVVGAASATQPLLRALEASVPLQGASAYARSAPELRAALKSDPEMIVVEDVRNPDMTALSYAGAQRGLLILASAASVDHVSKADVYVYVQEVRKLCAKQFAHKQRLSRAEQDVLEQYTDFAKVLSVLKEEGVIDKATQWRDVTFARAAACSECDLGYTGTTYLQEVQAPGFTALNLIEDGLCKAAQGKTSVEEILGLIS